MTIQADETYAEHVKDLLIDKAKELFEQFPDMESFGWHQCNKRWVDGRDTVFEESIIKPDISGALGEYIKHDPDHRQLHVAYNLVTMKKNLMEVFGDGVDVTVYKDLTIEVNDTNRTMAFEL